jgi:proton-dependent oligopeptide transporter, POT family
MDNPTQNQQASPGKHPKGLYVLFVTEMWERFSYYGMRAIFALYMIKALLFDKALTSTIYGSYTGLVYLTPLIGGYVADRYWGNRRSIFWGGVSMAIGQFLLFISAVFYQDIAMNPGGFSLAHAAFYGGLGFLIFGNGFFKPNISTMVGQIYPEGDKRLDSAMTIFYMGINTGALMAPLVAGGLGDTGDPADFKWGFLAACIGMLISVFLFEGLKNKYLVSPEGKPVGMPPERKKPVEVDLPKPALNMGVLAGLIGLFIGMFLVFFYLADFDFIGSFLYAVAIAAPVSIITDTSLTKIERQRILVIFVVALFVIFFWSAFEQAGVSLTFFAEEQTNRKLFGWEMPASYFQFFNPAFIVIFAPIATIIWAKLSARDREPASPYKQAIGLFLLALGYLWIAFGVQGLDPEVKVSMMWLIGLYWLHTMGELALSPIGLSMVVKLAPLRFTSLLMGVWFLAIATANKFAGTLSALYPEEQKLQSVYVINEEDQQKLAPQIETMDWTRGYFIDTLPLVDQVILFEERTDEVAEVERSFMYKVLKRQPKEPETHITGITITSGVDYADNAYKLKRVLPIEPGEKAKKRMRDTTLPEFTYGLGPDGKQLYKFERVDKEMTMEVWTLSPDKPKFMGRTIANLFDFFMIFVIMAGSASVILFVLSKWLLKMMHGRQ